MAKLSDFSRCLIIGARMAGSIETKVKLATIVEGDPKAPFSIATPFPGLLHFTLEPYLIMLSVKQGGIKYHF